MTSSRPGVAVVPAPAAVELQEGSFTVRAGTPVEFAAAGEVERIARYFSALVARTHGIELAPAPNAEPGSEEAIRFELSAVEGLSGEEGYSLRVSPQRIVVSAGSPRGLFYGAVTLWQLVTAKRAHDGSVAVPAMRIDDAPRFRWRGLMLDVARHYMPPEFIKQLIDWMAFWDDILEGGLAPNATVMSWRGAAGAIEAVRQGHDVVMAPAPVLYLDHLQSDSPDEPPGRPTLSTLADLYAFEPVPKGIAAEDAHHVLGAQANAWTEHMRTPARVEHAVFPRLAALAEVTWSQPQQRNFDAFLARLATQLSRYEKLGIRYAASTLEPYARTARAGGSPPLERRDEELKLCSNKLALHLEDDAPRNGERAVFLVDIMDPCWIYERAPLDGVESIAVTVGQIPFNFQLWKDARGVITRAAKSPNGDLEIRQDRCDGELLATLSLAPALAQEQLTTLEAPLAARTGAHDLCLTFVAGGPDPMWVIDRVELR